MPRLTKSVVDAATPREKQFTIWCSELKGFGLFVQPSGTRTYFVDYRNRDGVRKRMTIGRHGVITAEQARRLAIATLGETVKGQDPAEERIRQRKAVTVKELCERGKSIVKRRLTDDEYRLLGQILDAKAVDDQFKTTVQIIRHLALTACRRGEAIHLKGSEVDVDSSCLRLVDSKGGASVRPIGLPVLDLLAPLIADEVQGFVFKGTVEGKPLIGFPKLWKKLLKDTALADITPHVLRDSFSIIANDLGFTEATIGALIGHSRGTVTGRYIHTVDSLLVMAADIVAGYIQGLLDGKKLRRTTYALDRASRQGGQASWKLFIARPY
jgi:integrase